MISTDAVAFSGHQFGIGSVFLVGVGCSGSESTLTECPRSTARCYWYRYSAGVRCQGTYKVIMFIRHREYILEQGCQYVCNQWCRKILQIGGGGLSKSCMCKFTAARGVGVSPLENVFENKCSEVASERH